MGTSGSYSGGGGKVGKKLRKDINDWINKLPSSPPPDGNPPPPEPSPDVDVPPQTPQPDLPHLRPDVLLPVIGLLRPGSSHGGGDGPGGGGSQGGGAGRAGGGRSGGASRSLGASAGTAGRAATAAYAYQTGDAATLETLGLDFAELTALGDQYEIARRIAYAACERADSTIEDHEQRLVAAEIAEWVLTQDGSPPTPEEIVRHAIAEIVADAILSEAGEVINNSDHADVAEKEVRDAAEALASRAELSVAGVSEDQFTHAIEQGIETLRAIYKEDS